MGYFIIDYDGTVVSSSQAHDFDVIGNNMSPLLGIILTVQPSDAKGNFTAEGTQNRRGIRHECTVWATDDHGDPDILLTNVVIPPRGHSGIDDYEEDLPRGCRNLIDGSVFDFDFKDVDPGKLDGEWCVVNFIGGRIEYPFIESWWPHPSNVYDPATSGASVGNPTTLLNQIDKKGKSRQYRSLNGVITMISKKGDVYLDTTEAGRAVEVDSTKGTRKVKKVMGGGHVQVDMKDTSQLEFNWNDKPEKGARLGAGSTTQSPQQEQDFPHYDNQSKTGTPTARSTERTFMRFEEFAALIKSSDIQLAAKTEGSEQGQMTLFGTETVSIVQQASGDNTALVQIDGGKVTIQGKDGSIISITDDQIAIATKSGGQISVIGGQISISGPTGVTTSVPATFGPAAIDGIMLGTSYVASQKTLFLAWDTFLEAIRTYSEAIKGIADPVSPNPATQALGKAIDAFKQAKTAHEGLQTKYVSVQVKSQ